MRKAGTRTKKHVFSNPATLQSPTADSDLKPVHTLTCIYIYLSLKICKYKLSENTPFQFLHIQRGKSPALHNNSV